MVERVAVAAALSLLLVAGCATPVLKVSESTADFEMEARFSLQFQRAGEAAQQFSGGLQWSHAQDRDLLALLSPFGQTVGEIRRAPGFAEIRMADGQVRQGADAEALLLELTGYPLPIARLPLWFDPKKSGEVRALDARGRVIQVADQAWLIDYAYPEQGGAWPERLVVRRGNEMTLKLKITRWESPEAAGM